MDRSPGILKHILETLLYTLSESFRSDVDQMLTGTSEFWVENRLRQEVQKMSRMEASFLVMKDEWL